MINKLKRAPALLTDRGWKQQVPSRGAVELEKDTKHSRQFRAQC